MGEEVCEVLFDHVKSEVIERILRDSKTIAVVGLSTNPEKDSHKVPAFLQKQGYRIIPVHPAAAEILGEKAWRRLKDIPDKVDIVNVFRPPSELMGIVEEAIELGVKTVWAQEGIVSNAAAEKGEANGIVVVMDKCILKEYKAHFK